MKQINKMNAAQKKNLVNELLAPFIAMTASMTKDDAAFIMESAHDEVKSMGLGEYL